jgi:hypothetical protein
LELIVDFVDHTLTVTITEAVREEAIAALGCRVRSVGPLEARG